MNEDCKSLIKIIHQLLQLKIDTNTKQLKKVNLVILSVSSSFCVHQFGMWISEMTVAELAVETGCSSRFIAALFNVLQTLYIHHRHCAHIITWCTVPARFKKAQLSQQDCKMFCVSKKTVK